MYVRMLESMYNNYWTVSERRNRLLDGDLKENWRMFVTQWTLGSSTRKEVIHLERSTREREREREEVSWAKPLPPRVSLGLFVPRRWPKSTFLPVYRPKRVPRDRTFTTWLVLTRSLPELRERQVNVSGWEFNQNVRKDCICDIWLRREISLYYRVIKMMTKITSRVNVNSSQWRNIAQKKYRFS